VKDPEGRYLLANRAFEHLGGPPPEQMIGTTDFDYMPADAAERFRVDDVRVLQSGAVLRYEEVVPLPGGPRPFLTVKFPLRDVEGKPYAICGIATDITDLKKAEEALREADRRKDEFLAMLAHELRNPLAPVRNALHILGVRGLDEATVDRARQMMERQVEQLVRLVDDLLDVSRIMRGKIVLRKEPVPVAAVIVRAVETAQPVIDAQGHELNVSLPPQSLLIEGDLIRLSQVVGNLLTNAAKYTEKAGRIWLTAEGERQDVMIRVQDTGIGIPPELLPKVFDLFMQSERALDRSQGGLGIGLTLVKRLVEMHSGSVTAFSEGPGKGSTFTIRLPLVNPPDYSPPRGGQESDKGQVPAIPRRRILVVDDNVDAAESLAMMLRMWHHDVLTVYDGPEALAVAPSYRPEIVILDIGLPGISGYEVARRLRERPEFVDVLLVAMTGYGQDEDRRRSREAGLDHHLTKPANPDELHKLIASVSAVGKGEKR
jgi:PAS domain S-box-containing protein